MSQSLALTMVPTLLKHWFTDDSVLDVSGGDDDGAAPNVADAWAPTFVGSVCEVLFASASTRAVGAGG